MLLLPMGLDPPQGRAPGIDWTNPVAASLRFSCIALPGPGMIDLRTGKPFINNLSMTGAIDGALGPCVVGTGTTSQHFSASGYPTTIDSNGGTLAWIGRPTSFALALMLQNGNSGYYLRSSGTNGTIGLVVPGVGQSLLTGITLVAGHPYFIVASMSPNGAIGAAVDLSTGQIQTGSSSTANLQTTATTGYAYVGGGYTAASLSGRTAAAMYSPVPLSKAQQLVWAADPWSFWYPPETTAFDEIGRASLGALLALAGFSMSAGMGGASASALVAVSGLGMSRAAGGASIAANAALSGRSASMSVGRSSPAFSVGMVARTASRAAGRAALRAAASLAGRTQSTAAGRAAASFSASLVGLSARGMSAAHGAARLTVEGLLAIDPDLFLRAPFIRRALSAPATIRALTATFTRLGLRAPQRKD